MIYTRIYIYNEYSLPLYIDRLTLNGAFREVVALGSDNITTLVVSGLNKVIDILEWSISWGDWLKRCYSIITYSKTSLNRPISELTLNGPF